MSLRREPWSGGRAGSGAGLSYVLFMAGSTDVPHAFFNLWPCCLPGWWPPGRGRGTLIVGEPAAMLLVKMKEMPKIELL